MKLNRIPIRPWLWVLILALAPLSSAEWNEKVLYSFQGGNDGSFPGGGVVFDQQGNLYGVTQAGGPPSCAPIGSYCGTVYELSPPAKGGPWTKTLIYMFKGKRYNDGESPDGLIIDQAGNLYGVTAYGGTGGCVLVGVPAGCGTVYELSPPQSKGGQWTYTVLYNFKSGKDGYLPGGNLVFDSAGNLYGATDFGGGKGTTCNPYYQYCGTVFELSPPKIKGGKWTEKVLHSFAGGTDGANPNGGLVLDSTGAVYGTTAWGGGTTLPGPRLVHGVRSLVHQQRQAAAWAEEILHRFTDGTDGASPNGGLIFDPKGALYGTTGGSGSEFNGTVFRLTKTVSGRWAETIVHGFSYKNPDGGSYPTGLALDKAGDLYGTATAGGIYNGGVVYRLNLSGQGKTWSFYVLYAFQRTPDGSGPEARLIPDAAGNLYSTTFREAAHLAMELSLGLRLRG